MLSNLEYYSRAPVAALSLRYPYDKHIMQALSPAQWQEDFTAVHLAERVLLRWMITAAVNTVHNTRIAKPLDRLVSYSKHDRCTTHQRSTEFLTTLHFGSPRLDDRGNIFIIIIIFFFVTDWVC
jgi:hypothetical protein